MTLFHPWVAWGLGVWQVLLASAPFLLFGLLVAGLLHVLVPKRSLARWMGGEGLAASARAALIGIPLPICSCGIVPVAVALRRRGASRPATLAFLITTPESSADAIAVTWGLLGPVMAIVRPVVSFVTAMVAAAVAIVIPDRPAEPDAAGSAASLPPEVGCGHPGHGHTHHDPAHDLEEDEGYVGWRVFAASLRRSLAGFFDPRRAGEAAAEVDATAPEPDPASPVPPPFSQIVAAVSRRAFVDYVDDLVFWLLLGLLAAGAITAWMPPDRVAGLNGGGIALGPMLALLAIGIPMYICASASTPIAAALVAKGVSPGAALVFLLAGPATNAASMALIGRHLGRSFLQIYLASIAATTLACGIALDLAVAAFGLKISGTVASEAQGVPAFLQFLAALVLVILMVRRLAAGAWRSGREDLSNNLRRLAAALSGPLSRLGGPRRLRRSFGRWGVGIGLALWLGSGWVAIPIDSHGYRRLFGQVVTRDLSPGLAWAPPWPFGRIETRRVRYPRKADVGFRTDLGMLDRRALISRIADPAEWHSPVTAMNLDPAVASYLTGDENLIEMSFTVHYRLKSAYDYFFGLDKERDAVQLYAQASARAYVASRPLEDLLTSNRRGIERAIARELQRSLDRIGSGVAIRSVHVVDIHPPQEAVFAFRDVSSAREERETRIHQAWETLAREVPRAHGQASVAVAVARAEAERERVAAAGRAEGFRAEAGAYALAPRVLAHLLGLEAAERVLPGRRKFVLPPSGGSRLILWADGAPLPAPGASGAAGGDGEPPPFGADDNRGGGAQ